MGKTCEERTWRRRPKNAVQKPAAAPAPVYSVADDDARSNDPLILEKSYSMHGSERIGI